jgi:hypothetical protein
MKECEKSEVFVVVNNFEPVKPGNSVEDKTRRILFFVIGNLRFPKGKGKDAKGHHITEMPST